ncbi:protein HEXIM1-like [Uloborus diversus]|uniref:protein HEXIM1-like n=1 Tax=Uloborus diversus TaxID=327109 RepID=UPI00240947B4|nr:protein HEXIM1-like [Uloborus diversus]
MSRVDVILPPEKLVKCAVANGSAKIDSAGSVCQPQTPRKISVREKNKKAGNSNNVSKLNSDEVRQSDNSSEVRKRKNKNRRKRKWKPYSKLTWDERRELEERDSKRAYRIREEMTSYGLTLAPYNTTQFLMEDHDVQEPDYEHISNGHRHRENSNSLDSSDDYYSSPEDEEEFLQQQFVQTYEDIHAEHLNNMSKIELVQELVNMEDKVETLEKSLQEARMNKPNHCELRPNGLNVEAELEKIRVFREEIEKLSQENDILRRENDKLLRRLPFKT